MQAFCKLSLAIPMRTATRFAARPHYVFANVRFWPEADVRWTMRRWGFQTPSEHLGATLSLDLSIEGRA